MTKNNITLFYSDVYSCTVHSHIARPDIQLWLFIKPRIVPSTMCIGSGAHTYEILCVNRQWERKCIPNIYFVKRKFHFIKIRRMVSHVSPIRDDCCVWVCVCACAIGIEWCLGSDTKCKCCYKAKYESDSAIARYVHTRWRVQRT